MKKGEEKEYVEIEFENGDRYKGEVEDGAMHGVGAFERKGKYVYVGELVNNYFSGAGKLVDHSERLLYEGTFSGNKKEGHGRLRVFKSNFGLSAHQLDLSEITNLSYQDVIANSVLETLNTVAALQKQSAKLRDKMARTEKDIKSYTVDPEKEKEKAEKHEGKNGEILLEYEGEFKNDMREGVGRMNYKGGDRYKGGFKEDKRSGFGVLYYSSGECLRYVGNF